MICTDIETYQDDLDPAYLAWKTSNISAPSNYKDPAKIEAYIQEEKIKQMKQFALNPLTGKIILIGLLSDNADVIEKTPFGWQDVEGQNEKILQLEGNEKDILDKFWKVLTVHSMNDGEHIVSYNGKQFDLPFIIHRSTILNISTPRIIVSKLLNRYNHDPHLDLFNWFGSGSLVEWSYRLGLSDSLVRDGDKIGGWYESGQMQMIKIKNTIDLFQTFAIYKRVKQWV